MFFKSLREKRKLHNLNLEYVKPFDFKFTIQAKIISVYDGDTVTAVFKYNGIYSSFKIRLLGINTPEIRNSNLNKKRKAIEARDYLRYLILNKVVVLECKGRGKYGRILGNIFYNNIDINEKMITEGHAQLYP